MTEKEKLQDELTRDILAEAINAALVNAGMSMVRVRADAGILHQYSARIRKVFQ